MTNKEKIIFGILIAMLILLTFMIIGTIKRKKRSSHPSTIESDVYEKFSQYDSNELNELYTPETYIVPNIKSPGRSGNPRKSTKPKKEKKSRTNVRVNPFDGRSIIQTTAVRQMPGTLGTLGAPNVQPNVQDNTQNNVQPNVIERREVLANALNPLRQVLMNIHRQLNDEMPGIHPGVHIVIHNDADDTDEDDTDDPNGVLGTHNEEIVVRDRDQPPEEFFNEIQRNNHNDDPQNSHDSHVNMILCKKYNRLYELHIEQNKDLHDALPELGMNINEVQEVKIASAMAEIKIYAQHYIRDKYPNEEDPEQVRNANIEREKMSCVLEEIQKGYTITSISNAVDENGSRIAIAEDWILTLAWERIHSKDNVSVQDNLKESLYDQLIDATYIFRAGSIAGDIIRLFFRNNIPDEDTGTRDVIRPVCINGRVARVLSLFTLIDTDPVLSEPEKDNKEVANEAYTKANHILEQELDKFQINLPELADFSMRDLYIKDEDELTPRERTVVNNFSDHVKRVMTETLRNDYENIIEEKTLFNIINNSIAVV